MIDKIRTLSPVEQGAILASLLLACFLLVDPVVYRTVRVFDQETRNFFRFCTDLGKSGWILIPAGLAMIGLYVYRGRQFDFRPLAVSGYLLQVVTFLFVSVATTSLVGSLAKNIIGRARPKLFDQVGPFEFQPLTFDYAFASFPSGHATTICALAATLAIFWPRARVLLFVAAAWVAATRFLIGSHFLTDAIGGAVLGFWFPYFLRDRLAARRWLFERRPDGEVVQRGQRLWRWILARPLQRITGS
jgi:undecaprenyl-diphosphatase